MVQDHATLFVELVDRTDLQQPVVLKRDGVRITLDKAADRRAHFWDVVGDQVRGGHQLAPGDVIYVQTTNDQYWYLGEVTAVGGTPARRRYKVRRLEAVERGHGSSLNNDPRWQHPRPT